MTAKAVRILGVDPGINITGYGVLEVERREIRVCEAGVVRSRATAPLAERLMEIHAGLAEVIAALSPSIVAVEQLYSHYKHPRTAILMGHARGVLCLAAAQAKVPLLSYSATQIKRMLTGSGRAPKSQMQQAIRRELSLAELPQPADVADALAVALCHYHLRLRRAALVQKPA